MKVATVLASLFFSLPKEFDFFPKFFFVEGLDVANSLSRPPRSVIGIVSPPVSTVQPMQLSWPGHYQDKIRNIFPIRKILKNSVIDRQQRRIYYTRLCGQKNDDDEGSNVNSGDKSDESDDEPSPINLAVTADGPSTTMLDHGKNKNVISDFLYGANYVHSQYLSILWRYSILWSFAVTLPIGIALWMDQQHGLYNSLFRFLRYVLAMSSVAARFLQLPLEFAQSVVLSIWNISPETWAAAIDFLPNALAIPFVQLLLSGRTAVMFCVEACYGNNVIRFLSSMAAILVWRPAVEEWQYRSVLDKLLFGVPRWMLNRGQELSTSTITTSTTAAMAQRIKSIGGNVAVTIGISNNETFTSSNSSSSSLQEVEDLLLSNKSEAIDEDNNNPTGVIAVSRTNETKEEDVYAPFLPDESTRILLGSLLFATTRLGWLSSDPADTIALSNSPYGFTIGFLQSIGWFFSNGAGVPDVPHGLRIFILLLAIHQTVSSFFVAQHVFAGIYRQKGLAASVGAHLAWTVGKGTIPFRLFWKFWQSSLASVWSKSYGSRPDTPVGVDDDSSP